MESADHLVSNWTNCFNFTLVTASVHPLVEVKLLDAINGSVKFSDEEDQLSFASVATTNKNDGSDEDSD
jgi:hypothetical protein